jgi:hypothetical protein
MKKKLFLLVGVATLILASVPIAGQPLSLSDAQMDA